MKFIFSFLFLIFCASVVGGIAIGAANEGPPIISAAAILSLGLTTSVSLVLMIYVFIKSLDKH